MRSIVDGPSRFRWRAISREPAAGCQGITVIEDSLTGNPAAWFPEAVWLLTHPTGRMWAGVAANGRRLLRLEGDTDELREP